MLKAKFETSLTKKAEVRVDPRTKVGKRVDEYYLCGICKTDIVWNAKSCVGEDGCE